MIAIDMDMPENCEVCTFSGEPKYKDDFVDCNAVWPRKLLFPEKIHERSDWCPLHEVKFTEDEK